MSKNNVEVGHIVRCSGWSYCATDDCRHWRKHKARTGDVFHELCTVPQFCSVINCFVEDRRVLFSEEECDPNLAFRRRRRIK